MNRRAGGTLARALGLAREVHGEGKGVYLLYHPEAGKAWVGRPGKVHRLPDPSADRMGTFDFLNRRVEPPAFFMIGPGRLTSEDPQGLFPALAVCPEREWCLESDPGERAPAALREVPGPQAASGPVADGEGWLGEAADEFKAALAEAARKVAGRQGKIIATRGLKRPDPGGRSLLDLADRYLPMEPGAAAVHLCLLPGGVQSVGVSPEIVLAVRGGELILDAVAGSNRVHGDSDWERGLLESPKEAREHQLALDRALAFAARVCDPASVGPLFQRSIRTLRNIAHLQSRVHGRLREGVKLLDLLAQCHPPLLSYPAALRGKDEPSWDHPRFYGGQVGRWESGEGLSSFLNLRCLEAEGGWLHTRSGVGIVDGSDPGAEFQESLDKLATLFEAVSAWIQD